MNEKPNPQEPAQKEKVPLSDKKRNALLRYMAILFGVAFLMVLLSFLIQMRDSRETISDLSQSKAGALQRAELLQAENQQLADENNSLRASLTEVQTDQASLARDLDDAWKRLESAEDERDALEKNLQDREAQDDLLSKTAALLLAGDRTGSREALAKIDRAALTAQGQALYDQIQKALSDETAETAE